MSTSLSPAERALLHNVVRINGRIAAVICGVLFGAALWLATVILLVRSGRVIGPHLSLLAIFLPGYEVTWSGTWIGLLWGFVVGALAGRLLYWGYSRQLESSLRTDLLPPAPNTLTAPTLLISGRALGIGMGAAFALPLLLSTNWLVIRGTAAYSENAALLKHFLPFYTVSFVGSVIGAVELFSFAFLASLLFGGIYNAIARGKLS